MNILREKRKPVAVTICLCIVSLLLGAMIGYASQSTSTFTVSRGIYPGASSYTIWKESPSMYRAKNGYGAITSSGDAYSVIQATLNALQIGVGGDIYIKEGIYLLSRGLIYSPSQAQTLSIHGVSGTLPNLGTILVLNNASSPQPIFWYPSTAPVDCHIEFRNLLFFQIFPEEGAFNSPAIWIDRDCDVAFDNVAVLGNHELKWASYDYVPPASSIGIKLGHSGYALSGDMKTFHQVWVQMFETAFYSNADWVRYTDCVVWYSNHYAWRFNIGGGASLRPIMRGCHVYLAGGPYIIADEIAEGLNEECYKLEIHNFYVETAASVLNEDYNVIEEIIYAPNQPNHAYLAITQNLFYEYAPPDINATDGIYPSPVYPGSAPSGVQAPTTIFIWNRYNPLPLSIEVDEAYHNVNAASMRVVLNVHLEPTDEADGRAGLYITQNCPDPGPEYSFFYVWATVFSSATPAHQDQELTIDVPPGWYFFVTLSHASINNAFVYYADWLMQG